MGVAPAGFEVSTQAAYRSSSELIRLAFLLGLDQTGAGFGRPIMVNVSLKDSPPRPDRRPSRLAGWLLVGVSPPRWSVYLAIGVVIVVLAGIAVDRTLARIGERAASAGYSTDPTPLEIDLEGAALAIPGNMVRFAEQRRAGLSSRLDLFVRWPEFEGFSETHAEAFASSASAIVFVTLTPPGGVRDPIDRLETVYRYLFTGASWLGPNGLIGRRLADESAFAREELYYEPGSVRPFIARCLDESEPDILPVCLVEMNVAGLAVFYRFNRALLPEWRALDSGLRALVAGFRG